MADDAVFTATSDFSGLGLVDWGSADNTVTTNSSDFFCAVVLVYKEVRLVHTGSYLAGLT